MKVFSNGTRPDIQAFFLEEMFVFTHIYPLSETFSSQGLEFGFVELLKKKTPLLFLYYIYINLYRNAKLTRGFEAHSVLWQNNSFIKELFFLVL